MPHQKPIHNHKHLEEYRKSLRKRLTPAEAFLWSHIKTRQCHGIKFRRQHSINNFIIDFYCVQFKLGIELDGNYHNEPQQFEKDISRDEELKLKGVTILRYENKYVFAELEHVLEDIKRHCQII